MCHTVHKTYLGWDVTIRCSERPAPKSAADPVTFTAMAEAELQPGEDPANWIDPRVQLISTGNEFFTSDSRCVDDLFAQIRELIDALKR